ncbi:MAG: condensation domain-containing protein, partial [Bacteroidota bacterium]
GPTEASIDVSWYTTSAEDTFIPIGRPIWNTQLYIISRSNQLLPVETAGEICIGGVGLAQGYLNKPALTAEKFVQSSFRQGDRLYKTGDTGKWLPDGNIAFLGRNDNQVKIRGYRVEPGEIENALQSHPNIDAAVVITRELAGGIKDLIAYIVTNEPLTDTDIRVHIGRILPAYMLPGLIIRIKSLPLTASGKIDRKQLPAATGPALTGGIEYIAPRGPIEQRLATIWREVLALEQIGVQDEFFARGGHSLKAIRLASRIHKEFDVKIELSQLFKTTVLEEQAWLIAQTTRTLFSGIIPAGQQSHYPLSSSQRRLWVLSQFEGGSIAYNMPGAYVLNGSLNLAALTHSFTTLIGRHEILRTVFREDEKGEPRQFICPEQQAAISINCLDLRQQEQPDEKLQSLLKISFTRPFDLYTGPLLRAELYQLSENKWVISFVMHHIISDGWSLDVLIRELLQFYNAYADGSTFSLPPLTIQYKDYTVWQQAQLSGEDLDIHRQYWMAQFQGELPVLEMPADKLRPAIKTYHGGVVHKKINAGLTEAIRDYSRRQGGTLFMNLLAALSALLYRYTGQTDFIIGTPVAGRDHLDLEGQIGLYVNMLALRIAFGSDHNYQELAAMVKKITLSAYQHQNFPFDTLVDELKLHRDTSRSPLFDVMIVLQNEEKDLLQEIRPGEITVERITATDETTSKFDLTFNFIERAGQLELAIEYNNHIYEFSSVSRMAGHFERLLDEMLRNPAVPVGQLSYISCEEKQHLLEVFNNTLSPYPMDETVITLFEKRVALSPGNIAILFEDTSITYAELNEWANRLGNYLRDKYGVGEGRPVGIKLERSEWMIIAILGVLKSGGSYVPIDPDYPRERIEYMLKDSKCGVLIDEDGLSAFRQEKDNYETRNLQSLTKPDDPIYIIYTSGSTGRPKGAMIKHHSFVNLALWYERLLELSEKDCVLLMAPISFDLAQKNIFTTLLRGAKLCLPGKLYGDYMLLAETIQQNKVTVINAAPSAFYPLLDTSINGEFKRLSSLRKIVLGGEPIMTKEFLNWVESGFYNGQVINSYGPTECTDVVSSYTIDNTAWTTLKKVPIGVPIDNSRIYILDNGDGLVPVG